MDYKTRDMKDTKIAYLLLLLTGAFGGHRFYVQKWHKGLIYLIVFWILSSVTLGYLALAILTYEAFTLKKKILISNGEIEEDSTFNLMGIFSGDSENVKNKIKLKDIELQKTKAELADIQIKLENMHIKFKATNATLEESGLLSLAEIESRKSVAEEKLKAALTKQEEMKVNIRSLDLILKDLRVENDKHKEIARLNQELKILQESTAYWQEVADEESMGIFTRPEELYPSEYYIEELRNNKTKQKELKKENKATRAEIMTLDGSATKGAKLQKDNVKQILRAFDNEADVMMNTLTIKNYNSKEKALNKSFEQLNKINSINGIEILPLYLKLKMEELKFAHKGLIMKEEEKEVLREEREREREEKAALREIESKKAVVDKDITHYNNMVEELQKQILSLKDENKKLELEKEIESLEGMKEVKEKEKESLDFREKNAKAGYVYIISNIGSLGENVFKIGVTRRLEPYERIAELSSASVPFRYDVHAMVFSNDAFKLESSLHKTFGDKRVNLINNRKEFFNVTIDEIKEALEEYKNLTINFREKAEAIEYRETIKLKKKVV